MENNQSSSERNNDMEVATLAGGCFWCLEAIFNELEGVERVVSGYSGGKTANPSYKEVCGGRTGHAEAVQVVFDPKVISYREILALFFSMHDPTTLNCQGADVGTQYRSVIFYHDDKQKAIAEQLIKELDAAKIWDAPIVTEVTPFSSFYSAEDYHQHYFKQNMAQPYCQVVIAPKLAKFREHYSDKLKNKRS